MTDVEETVAKILATQYYNGWKSKKKCNFTREEYLAESLHNWISAARGIITLVKNPSILNKEKCWLCGGSHPETVINVECETPGGRACDPHDVQVHFSCYMEVE